MMRKLLFIEAGMGIDLHGQDVTKASVRAARNAIHHNSMPGLSFILPNGDLTKMKVHVILGVPFQHNKVDTEQVKSVFPYGNVSVEVREGGLLASSGIFLEDKGDISDELVIVNAVVEVGYDDESSTRGDGLA